MPKTLIRKMTRLKEYDYSQSGYYYITICVNDRTESFGKVVDGKMLLNKTGTIVGECWENIADNFDNVELGEYIIMPNHIHGIITICRGLIHQTRNNDDNQTRNNNNHNKSTRIITGMTNQTGMINHAPTDWILMKNHKTTLGKIIRHFKARATKIIHDSNINDFKWQRSFYDHIIRDDISLNRIREYIINNPVNWDTDENNIRNHKGRGLIHQTRNNGINL
ncbi:MAG: transposase [Candidatus Omnitrophica bacterium]|nr:transposase [Candidatus Omnitrophota bacterium]